MSARNTLAAKRQRRSARWKRHLSGARLRCAVFAHGVCRARCGRRTGLWLPARYCGHCLTATPEFAEMAS